MRFTRYLPAVLLGVFCALAPEMAWMAPPAPPDPCSVVPGLPCNGSGSSGLASWISSRVFSGTAKTLFGSFLTLYFFVYAARLIILGEKSDVIDETKYAYAYGVSGAAMYIFAGSIIEAVGSQNGTGINTAPVDSAVMQIIGFLNGVIGALLLATLTYQAIRLILKRGDESAFGDLRKRFMFLIGGIVTYLLANVIINAAAPGSGSTRFIVEIVGIIRYMLEIIGFLAVVTFVFAGFLYVISIDEGRKDRAKQAMKNTAIALIVVLFAYVIIRFVANGFQL